MTHEGGLVAQNQFSERARDVEKARGFDKARIFERAREFEKSRNFEKSLIFERLRARVYFVNYLTTLLRRVCCLH